MKYLTGFILLTLALSNLQCKFLGTDCPFYIVIKNHSNSEIILADPGRDTLGNCTLYKLDHEPLQAGDSLEYRPFNFCIERSMSESETITIYVIDPSQFNEPNAFYSCDADSIAANNLVLARYELTLADLRDLDFTINYP